MACRTVVPFLLLCMLAAQRLAAQCPDGSPPPCRGQPARSTPAPPPNSVAVLYFDNLSRDTADAYLADGLTEEIIARLGQIERLRVKSRTTVQRYRGRSIEDPGALGRTLGVAYLVSGTVRRAGPRVRIAVELVRTASGDRVWGEQYDRSQVDLLAIEEDIARTVATAVSGRLLPAERASLAARATRHPQAYDHLLRGNYYLAQRTPRAVARAIEEYGAAVSLDPGFSAAFARIGLGYSLFLSWGWDYPEAAPEGVLARGFEAADEALRLDSTTSDGWIARGQLLRFRFPRTYEGVRAALERAVALDPRNVEAYYQYGVALTELGDDSGAVVAFRRALALKPEGAATLVALGSVERFGRRYDEALRWLDSALTVDPGFYAGYLLRAYLGLFVGRVAEARADAEIALRLAAGDFQAEVLMAMVDARAGNVPAARTRVDSLLRPLANRDQLTMLEGVALSIALTMLGEHERALDLLEQVRPRGRQLWLYLREPGLDPIRSHPRFQPLVEESRPPGAPR